MMTCYKEKNKMLPAQVA